MRFDMKRISHKYLDFCILLVLTLLGCCYLWYISALPPYGTPLNELSDHYWGILIDIARQWKTGEFAFWTRSIGGGFCLYSSGFYPLWSPGNIIAKWMSYDHFYIFKLIEPYFIGLFAMGLLLRRGLRLSFALTCYGALAYMGFVFTRDVGILHHPFFLWACAVFPLMLYCYAKLFKRHIYLRSAVMGAFMSLIFIGGGAGQYAQMIIWSMILLGMDAILFVEEKSWIRKIVLCVTSYFVFLFFAITIAGIQLLPTLSFTFLESIRTLGEYPINNFPLFRNDYKGQMSITKLLHLSIFANGDQGVRAFWALMFFAAGKLIVDWKAMRQWGTQHRPFVNAALATLFFFCVPPIAELLSNIFPLCAKLFNPLRMITFGYCGFMIDMLMVIFLVVVLGLKVAESKSRKNYLFILLILTEIYLFLPLWLNQFFPQHNSGSVQIAFDQRYVTMMALILFAIPWQKNKILQNFLLLSCLIFLGGQLLHTSYVWGEKGQRTARARFYFETPEHAYYQSMKRHYYMAYVEPHGQSFQYETMMHNYDLLFDVDGVNGFLNIPPKRFNNFMNAYHKKTNGSKNTIDYKYDFGATPASLTTYFPVEFTTVGKGMNLPWPGFSKVVDGTNLDVWKRDVPVERVKFSDQIQVVSFRELIDSFDRPYHGTIYMTAEDWHRFLPRTLDNVANFNKTKYRNFLEKHRDYFTFDVSAASDVYVLVPEIYQAGWQLRVDDRAQPLFPADSIFMGFALDKGEHTIELEYRPVLWHLGLVVSLIGTVVFLGIFIYYRRVRRS